MTRAFYFSSLFILFILFLSCKNTQELKLNVLFILVNDLGYADLGYNGSNQYHTPNVDTVAASGIVFTDAYASSPICSPSRAAVMSGKSPARLRVTDYIPGNRHWGPHKDQKLASKPFNLKLDLEEYTIAEAFKEAGYKTIFTDKWHLEEEEKYYSQFQGFDINKGGNKTGHPVGGFFSPYKNAQLNDGFEGEYLTGRLSNEIIDFISMNKKQPFFAYLSFYTVHLPMQGKSEKVKNYPKKFNEVFHEEEVFTKKNKTFHKNIQNKPHYAAMVESMDKNIGRILTSLKKIVSLKTPSLYLLLIMEGCLPPIIPTTFQPPMRR